MPKFLLKFLLFILLIAITLIIFLNYVGLETDKFNNLIKNKANQAHQHVKLDFENTKIHIRVTLLILLNTNSYYFSTCFVLFSKK